MIAEKKFKLLPALIVTPAVIEDRAPHKLLYRKKSKKTGKLIGEGPVFEIKNKQRVRASVELMNRFGFADYELISHIYWIGPDSGSFYRKRTIFIPLIRHQP